MKLLRFFICDLPNVSIDVEIMSYNNFVRPIAEYVCLVWDPMEKQHHQARIHKTSFAGYVMKQ